MARLTDKKVAEIKPRKVAREIREGSIGGLFLAVQTSGTKSWVLRFRIDGRSRKMTLGSFPALTAAAAREAAKEALELIKNGVDPIAAKMETKAAGDGPKTTARNVVPDKIEDVVHAFVANHVRRKKRPMKPASQRTAERHLTKLLAAFPGRRLSSLKLAEVKKSLIDPLAEIGKGISANRAVSTLTSLINFARKNDFIKDNPLLGLERPVVEESRDRVLTDVELATVMTAARKVGYPFGDIVQILALTGQRRGEATQMQWPELDLENGRWELSKERTKNKKPHTVMLSAAVVAILKNVKRGDAGNFVFSINDGASPFTSVGMAMDNLRALMPDIERWTLHDLRRSAATNLAKLEVPLHIIEKILNHQSSAPGSAIAAIYNRHSYDKEKREAMEKLAVKYQRFGCGERGLEHS